MPAAQEKLSKVCWERDRGREAISSIDEATWMETVGSAHSDRVRAGWRGDSRQGKEYNTALEGMALGPRGRGGW